jgi:glycosyltransferase involved in cell wall biosynthesis
MTNWASMVAADLVLFNSDFHRTEWFEALPAFLRRFPDQRHGSNLIDLVSSRSEVVPVGVDLVRLDGPSPPAGPRPLLTWNQRWDHDKGPDLFTSVVLELFATGVDFDLALLGEQFVSNPTGFEEVREALGSRVVHYGFAPGGAYGEVLRKADVVVSTSRQEFFGVAITEAIYAGAFPLLPNRLVYPERLPDSHHDPCLYDDHDDLVAKLGWALQHPDEASRLAAQLKPVMAAFEWSLMAPIYDNRFESLVSRRRRGSD